MTVLSTLSKQTRLTAEAGILIAVVLTGWKFQSIYQDIVKSAYKDFKKASTYFIDTSYRLHSAAIRRSKKFSKSRINSAIERLLSHPRVQICIALFQYFIRFPLFVALFRIIMKCFALSLKQNRYLTAISTFITAYICQYKFRVFHWKWTLFLLIRSMHSLTRLLIPKDMQPNVKYVYPVIHGFCGIMLTWFYDYVPNTWWSLFETCLNEKRQRCKYMFCHNHSITAPCNILHDQYNIGCLESLVKDIIYKIPYILGFFAKFYALTTLINVSKCIRAIRKKKLGVFLLRILKNLIGSSCFFIITAVSFRLPCFYGSIIKKTSNKPYVVYNKVILVYLNIILGYFAIICESESRRVMVTLSCVWNICTEIVRMMFNLKSDDNAKCHKTLESNNFSSLLFAINMAIIMFVYCSNPNAVSSMERRLIKKYFV